MHSTDHATVLALLGEISGKLTLLLERQRKPGYAAYAEPLRVIALQVGTLEFSSSELLEYAAMPGNANLRAAIVALAGSISGKKLGKLFRRIEGVPIGGLCVERRGIDRDGVIWRLRVCEF